MVQGRVGISQHGRAILVLLGYLGHTDARGDSQRLGLAVLLKCFQNLAYFPALANVPEFIVDHIRSNLGLATYARLTEARTSLYRYHAVIRNYMGVTTYSEGGETVATATIEAAVQTMNNPADLINASIEELIRQRFELPGYSHLDRLANHIRFQVNEAWYQMILGRLCFLLFDSLRSRLQPQADR